MEEKNRGTHCQTVSFTPLRRSLSGDLIWTSVAAQNFRGGGERV
jgi:hypothetical protein